MHTRVSQPIRKNLYRSTQIKAKCFFVNLFRDDFSLDWCCCLLILLYNILLSCCNYNFAKIIFDEKYCVFLLKIEKRYSVDVKSALLDFRNYEN